MSKTKHLLKKIAPLYFRFLRVQYKDHRISWRNAFFVALVSFLYAFLGSGLTVMISSHYGAPKLFIAALFYYTAVLFSTKVMAFSKTIGQVVYILSAAIGLVVATQIF